MSELHRYEVGKLYSPNRTRWPEAVDFNYRQGVFELRLFFGSPSSREIRDVERGPCEFALFTEGDLVVLLYRFGQTVAWSDAPYSWHLVPQEQRTLPEAALGGERRDTMQIILIDAATGIIRALRIVSFSPAFSAALRLAIREQASRPWPGDAEYNRQVQALYQRYPTSEMLLRVAKIRTVGGA